ncbi:MAG: ABC transporter permease [Chloroflexi bacterium]|nr:ABC transporter permease [Chloroflexota bacterium]
MQQEPALSPPKGTAIVLPAERGRRSSRRAIQELVRTQPLGTVGILLLLIASAVAIAAPWLAPFDPNQQHYESVFQPPGGGFLLGTDNFGRDGLSRLMWGGRITLYVGLLSIALGSTGGFILGIVSGFWGGVVDAVLQRLMDILMSFPLLVLAIVIVSSLGPSVHNVVLAIAIVVVPRTARVLRSSALSVKATQYVDAARAIGCGQWRILRAHIAPNCFAPYIIMATISLAEAILIESTLSFLGMGAPPPAATWGSMLSEARSYMRSAPWLAVYPGLAVSVAIFSANMLGDAVRDLLDPRLRGSR